MFLNKQIIFILVLLSITIGAQAKIEILQPGTYIATKQALPCEKTIQITKEDLDEDFFPFTKVSYQTFSADAKNKSNRIDVDSSIHDAREECKDSTLYSRSDDSGKIVLGFVALQVCKGKKTQEITSTLTIQPETIEIAMTYEYDGNNKDYPGFTCAWKRKQQTQKSSPKKNP